MPATPYIDRDYLIEVVGEDNLVQMASSHADAPYNFTNPTIATAVDRAIASANGDADTLMGRRFTADQLAGLTSVDAVRSSVAYLALFHLAPATEMISEALTERARVARKMLERMGKGVAAAGNEDPEPPPLGARSIDVLCVRGLANLGSV